MNRTNKISTLRKLADVGAVLIFTFSHGKNNKKEGGLSTPSFLFIAI